MKRITTHDGLTFPPPRKTARTDPKVSPLVSARSVIRWMLPIFL